MVLNDRYRLTEHIGVGGTADVWRATDELLNREVAVKILRDAADPTQRERFIEETRTLASFNHPGLVVLLDAGVVDARPFLVMTLAGNSTLASRVARGPVESSVVKAIGSQIALALDYVHGRGVVHRDVKPSNVLLWDDGRAVLSDFGIARLIGSTMHHTRTGEAIGSPAYLAPEQVAGEPLTPAVDIYSLGLVLLEALTARRAFPGAPIEAAIARLTTSPALPTTIGPEWSSLLTRMTDRDPDNRPTARAVADELGGTEFATAPVGAAFDPEATGAFSLLDPGAAAVGADAATTMSMAPLVAGADVGEPQRPLDRRRWASLAAVALAALALGAFTLFHPAIGASKTGVTTVPTKAPTQHRAVVSHVHETATASTQAPVSQPTRTPKRSAGPGHRGPAKPSKVQAAPTATPTSGPASSAPPTPTPSPAGQPSAQVVTSPTP